MRRALAALAVLIAGAALAGCSGRGDAPPAPEPPAEGTGYFAGRTSAGLGVAVDLLATEPTARVVLTALVARGRAGPLPAVAVVSLVNRTSAPIRPPVLRAVRADGAVLPLLPVEAALAGAVGPAARAARARAGDPAAPLPAGSARLDHLVLEGTTVREVVAILVSQPDGGPLRLSPRRR